MWKRNDWSLQAVSLEEAVVEWGLSKLHGSDVSIYNEVGMSREKKKKLYATGNIFK